MKNQNDRFAQLTGRVRLSMLAAGLLGTVTVPARAGEPLILTPRPGPSPRINGPKIFGVRPGSPLLFKIPASGERPLRYAREGAARGARRGRGDRPDHAAGSTHPGTHDVVFEVSNTHGATSRPFRIVCGETLALTPHMGWNSWYVWENNVTDKIIRDAADAMVRTGMIDHGYMYVNIDDCWAVKPGAPKSELGGEPRDAQGRVNPNGRFPDMKALADHIHARGLKAGIYTSPGPLTCGGHVGAYQHEEQDVRRVRRVGLRLPEVRLVLLRSGRQEPGPGRASGSPTSRSATCSNGSRATSS